MIDPCSPEAKAVVTDFLSPYTNLRLGGRKESLKVDWQAKTIIIPDGYRVMGEPMNMEAALHEIGHVIDLPTRRAARGLKFGSGLPLLTDYGKDNTAPQPHSAYTEGRAMAWQARLAKDLLGQEPDFHGLAKSLRFASDFAIYEGSSASEKIGWAATVISSHYSELAGIDAAKAILERKNREIPVEIDRQIGIANSEDDDWTLVWTETFEDWTVEIKALSLGPLGEAFCVSCSSDIMSRHYDFSSLAAAEKFRDRVVSVNRLEIKQSAPAPTM